MVVAAAVPFLGTPLIFGPERPDAAVIFLHGHAEGPEKGWPRRFKTLRAAHPSWQWLHLRAPELPQSCWDGAVCKSWGNYISPDCTRVGNEDYDNPDSEGWYAASVSAVHACVDSLVQTLGLSPADVAIVGFSQGAAVALEAALTYKGGGSRGGHADHAADDVAAARPVTDSDSDEHIPVGACVALCGWLFPRARAALDDLTAGGGRAPAVLVMHGTSDDWVEFKCSEDAEQRLRAAGVDVALERYGGWRHGDEWPPAMYTGAIESFLLKKLGKPTLASRKAELVDAGEGRA